MTNKDLTLIAVLCDHSYSMTSCRSQMEGGLNEFIASQAAQPGHAEITLAEFDHSYKLVWPIMAMNSDLKYCLVPRGNTALLDAMGRFITDVGQQLRNRKEYERPNKVIVCIVTDGMENASRSWTKQRVRDLITQQREQWQWEFVFLGAGMDAVAEGMSFGIPMDSAMTYTTANAGETYASLNNYVNMSRSGLAASFTSEDRQAAVK